YHLPPHCSLFPIPYLQGSPDEKISPPCMKVLNSHLFTYHLPPITSPFPVPRSPFPALFS
ncbi:MAG: hypothetical protein WA919_00390, partial [Coleofasciculaceae cyanobacterium]